MHPIDNETNKKRTALASGREKTGAKLPAMLRQTVYVGVFGHVHVCVLVWEENDTDTRPLSSNEGKDHFHSGVILWLT